MHQSILALTVCVACASLASASPASAEESDTLHAELERILKQLPVLDERIRKDPQNVRHYSERGDARFFLGKFAAAAEDYDRMVELNPALDASHWRRGIAWFYAGEFERAAAQFERYHSFDDVDRENGIWRYLCQVKAKGVDAARRELLRYEKDDREPFRDVYRLFSEEITAESILEQIHAADIDDGEREKRLFYAHLYIGLWHAAHGRPDSARKHLRPAADNTWAPSAGYGPRYMWHVARLHYDSLRP